MDLRMTQALALLRYGCVLLTLKDCVDFHHPTEISIITCGVANRLGLAVLRVLGNWTSGNCVTNMIKVQPISVEGE